MSSLGLPLLKVQSIGHDEFTAKYCYFRSSCPPDVDGITMFDKDDQATIDENKLRPGKEQTLYIQWFGQQVDCCDQVERHTKLQQLHRNFLKFDNCIVKHIRLFGNFVDTGNENGDLAVLVSNTLVHYAAFLASDT